MSSDFLSVVFEKARCGDEAAKDMLYRQSFGRLRSIASALLKRERLGHTLQPTALVNELFLKMHRFQVEIVGEEHFFHLSARAMKQVLVDYSRVRSAKRRIAPQAMAEMIRGAGSAADPDLCLAAKLVFEQLKRMDATSAAAIWMRYVEGLSTQEIARGQVRAVWRVKADCDFGIRWMAGQLERRPPSSSSAISSAQAATSEGRSFGSGA